MPNLDIRQSEGLKKLNLIQCGTHGKLFSAKNPDAYCPQCGPQTLAAVQIVKQSMGLMPVNPNQKRKPAPKSPRVKPANNEGPAELKRLLSVPASDELPAGMKHCRSGKHIIAVDAKRCLPCNNEGAKARREAKAK